MENDRYIKRNINSDKFNVIQSNDYLYENFFNNNFESFNSNLINDCSQQFMYQKIKQQKKEIIEPYKQLNAPNIVDDFYLNLMDWATNDILSIALQNNVYIYKPFNSKLQKFVSFSQQNNACSVNFHKNGDILAIGDNLGSVYLYDVNKQKQIHQYKSHISRVGSLSINGNLLASGSRDRTICLTDMRTNQFTQFQQHKQEICGLKWSCDGLTLASGGNDNKLSLYSLRQAQTVAKISAHNAAVKAIGFSHFKNNLLATGGGTADRKIKFWDTNTLKEIKCIDTGSQVCNLLFSKHDDSLISSHGYSLNQINIWDENMNRVNTLIGHQQRVLYLCLNNQGTNIVSAAGDGTIKFWNIFKNQNKQDMREIR